MFEDNDQTAPERKKNHIELAFKSQIQECDLDLRFYYEPLLAAHPKPNEHRTFQFLGKTMNAPLWVSSMTGGTELARTINHNLARVARDFGFGMGLGSCRSLLTSNEYLSDFAVRSILGDSLPLYANLGVAQVEKLLKNNQTHLITELLDKLQADGLIIHVNPMQEWLQPEGDYFEQAPLTTILQIIEKMPHIKLIVKEVGQGMGYHSLKALLQLPIEAIEFAAGGGTNFAQVELLRSNPEKQAIYAPLASVGHSAEDMVVLVNELIEELGKQVLCKQLIISGGVKSFLDGYFLVTKAQMPAIYGQASAFLRYARGSYEELYEFVEAQIRGFALAQAYLKIR